MTMELATYIKYIEVLEQHMLPIQISFYSVKVLHISAKQSYAECCNWKHCHIIKWKILQRSLRSLEQLESYVRQEWDNIPFSKVQQLGSSVPRCSQTVRLCKWHFTHRPNLFGLGILITRLPWSRYFRGAYIYISIKAGLTLAIELLSLRRQNNSLYGRRHLLVNWCWWSPNMGTNMIRHK